jgi:hypothetical protein
MRHLYIEHVVQIVEAIITNNHTRSLTPAIRGLKPRLQRDGAMRHLYIEHLLKL